MDDYLSARPITSPFGLYDCDVPCDASIAVDRVRRRGGRRPAAPGHPDRGRRHADPRTGVVGPGDAHARAPGASARPPTCGRGPTCDPSDVDLALLYDGFTFNAISWIEALGFCGFGEAYDWLDGGRRIALGGELPVNPHGGQLSEGRTHGFGFLYEAVQPAAPRCRRAPGARRPDGRGHLGRRHPLGSPPPAAQGRLTMRAARGGVHQPTAGARVH